ncbi:DsrE family protein [Thermodesulfobium sp. 4217-1]|uniref:DsrE family protein n=1 Tax=Thermodesulfobium sp. 4217-1 TaxID=3120013 RepID=UPI00322190E1
MAKKAFITLTSGPDNPEKVIGAFIMSNAAFAMDYEVTMWLQSGGVFTAVKGMFERIMYKDYDPLEIYVKNFIEQGGKFYLCVCASKARNITEKDLVSNAQIVGAGRAMLDISESDLVMFY